MSWEIPRTDLAGGRLRELFEAASERPGEERSRFLDEVCAHDPDLRRALADLLKADEEAESNPIWKQSALHAAALAGEQPVPFENFGPYRILQRIGAGGMGVVYLAEGDYDGVRKRVAIKAMPFAFDDEMVRRFRQERRIVASLEHPNIARMLDAGTTPAGIPYLVMEYVDGIPLNRYASERELSRDARLNLFRTICLAVACAHRNLIVHRDLKPGNILITDDGVPKLLDFGIARLLDEPRRDVTGVPLMTPGYASPEQLEGKSVTTASDIYSLGVILVELLTGEKPGGGKPLAGDIDNVVSMALRQEPERRYSSAADFAEDVRRVIERYPVIARHDTVGYRLRKFVSRRPVEVTIMLALTIAAIVTGAAAFEQYRSANRHFDEVRAIANSSLFDIYDSIGDFPGATRTRLLIASRAQQYLDALAHDRSSDLALRRELATAYLRLGDILGRPSWPNLGDNAGALANYRKSQALLEGIAAARRNDAASLRDLGEIYGREGRMAIRRNSLDEALAADDRSREMLERVAALQPGSREARTAAIDASLDTALAHLELGEERVDLKHVAAGESLSERAKSGAGELLRQDPSSERFGLLKAKACEYLAFAENVMAKLSGSSEYQLRAARNFQERLDLELSCCSRNADKYRRTFADAYVEASTGWRGAGDFPRAEVAAREGLRRFEQIAAADPTNREAAFDVVTGDLAVGYALASRQKGAEAMVHFTKFLDGEKQTPGVQQDRATIEAMVEVRGEMAAFLLKSGRKHDAIQLYWENIGALQGSAKPSAMVSLALNYELLASADLSHAARYNSKASELWVQLRDSHRMPPRYAGKVYSSAR